MDPRNFFESGAGASQLQWRTLLQAIEQNPVTILITDRDGRIEYSNPQLTELTGYTVNEVKGQTPRIFKSGLTPVDTYEQLWTTIKSGREWRGQLQNRKKDGSLFWEDIRISPVLDDSGAIRHFVAIKEDISARKAAEDALHASEARFRTTFEQAAVGIAHVAPDGHFLLINQRFCDLVGYTYEEMLSKTFQDITHPDDLNMDLAQVQRMLAREIDTYSLEKRYIRKNQALLWVQLTVSLAWNADGQPDYFISVVQDISKRKAALEALSQSERDLKRSQAVAHVGHWIWYPQTNTVHWSDEMHRIFGVDPALFTGDLNAVIDAAIHPDDRAKVYAANLAVINEHRPATMEYRVVWPDDSVRYIWAQPSDSVLDQKGNVLALSGIVQDITDRKLAEIRLRESERFAYSTLDALSAEIAILDETGTIIAVNEAWRAFASANAVDTSHLGEGANYLAATEAVDSGSGDQGLAAAFASGIRSVMSGEKNEYSLEYPCHAPTEKRWFIGRVTRFAGDGPLRLVVAHENITERKLAELAIREAHVQLAHLHETVRRHNIVLEETVQERTAQLRRLNDRMAIILNNISDAIVLLDSENRIENTNQSFDRLFGYARDELFGQPFRIIADGRSTSDLTQVKQAVRDTHKPQRVQISARHKSGRTFDADVALAYVAGNAHHLVCSIRDITYLKEVDRAKDVFLAMVSHELKNPIAAIVLSAETLSHYYDRITDEKRLEKIIQIQRQAGVLTELVTAILDTARYDSRQRRDVSERIDIQQIVNDVIAEFVPQVELNQQQIKWENSPDSLFIPAERSDIARIWRNLIGNAIKYSGKGSNIEIQLYSSDTFTADANREVVARCLPTGVKIGNYVLGIVADDGPGIPEQDLPHLFTRFFRGWAGATDLPGTGLGLSLVKDIVQSYGGDVAAHSIPDGGSIFCFWLPGDDV